MSAAALLQPPSERSNRVGLLAVVVMMSLIDDLIGSSTLFLVGDTIRIRTAMLPEFFFQSMPFAFCQNGHGRQPPCDALRYHFCMLVVTL